MNANGEYQIELNYIMRDNDGVESSEVIEIIDGSANYLTITVDDYINGITDEYNIRVASDGLVDLIKEGKSVKLLTSLTGESLVEFELNFAEEEYGYSPDIKAYISGLGGNSIVPETLGQSLGTLYVKKLTNTEIIE